MVLFVWQGRRMMKFRLAEDFSDASMIYINELVGENYQSLLYSLADKVESSNAGPPRQQCSCALSLSYELHRGNSPLLTGPNSIMYDSSKEACPE